MQKQWKTIGSRQQREKHYDKRIRRTELHPGDHVQIRSPSERGWSWETTRLWEKQST